MKRRKSWLAKAIAAVALVCAIAFALFRFVFVVRSVDVIGAPAEEAPEIVRAGNVEFGGSIFGVDTQAIIAGIAETGDYYAVDVAGSLPNRLHITVQQRTPVAMTLFMQSILIMDADGYVISACDSVPDMDLVYVSDLKPGGYKIGSVVQADQDRLENLRAALHAIAENGAAAYISELNVADSRAIKIISRTRRASTPSITSAIREGFIGRSVINNKVSTICLNSLVGTSSKGRSSAGWTVLSACIGVACAVA